MPLGPLDYGMIYVRGNSNLQDLPDAATYAKLTDWANDGAENGRVNADVANDRLVALDAGVYLVAFQVAFSGTANKSFYLEVRVNSASQDQVATRRKLGAGGDVGSCSGIGLVTCAANDPIELYAKGTDNGDDICMQTAQLVVVRIG